MRKPTRPPDYQKVLLEMVAENPAKFELLFANARSYCAATDTYPHWDKLRYLSPPDSISHKEWWLALKVERSGRYKTIPLLDKYSNPFRYTTADPIAERLHEIDLSIGGGIQMPAQITNPNTRDQYYVESLIEEAITSSQLEGATTTRRVAREMIRAGRKPSDRSEQMILNGFQTMQAIADLRKESLTKDLVFELHRLITQDTLDDPASAGRFRTKSEHVVVADDTGEIFHDPPAADQLDERMAAMCDFANQKTPAEFLHPALRAMMLHFWLSYDHPFVDGNGRTARALFYWAMLKYGYWLCEFLSISTVILKGPSKYSRAFLYTESDDNDLTYFLLYHVHVLHRAILALQAYIQRQVRRVQEFESKVRNLSLLNHRQRVLISHALRHPQALYTIRGHQRSHQVVYQTARTDLLDLTERGLLEVRRLRRQMYYSPVSNLEEALAGL